jgi:Dolichyl-phosphate-mannose-protein mannosyltransferase
VRTLAPFVLLAALVAVATAPRWGDPIPWTPDGLYYEAQTRELEGEEARAARAVVFSSDLAALPRAREQDAPPELRRVGNPGWVEYSAEFYRRRWTVPLAALALRPVAYARSIQIVSLVGYAVFGLTLFALLRRSFGTVASGLAAATILAVPQLYEVALAPLTDTWGLVLLAGGMALAVQALRRGRIWLLPFAAVLATLSLTRDNAWVLIGALLLYAVRWRSRRAAGLAALGAVVVLPAHLAFPVDAGRLVAFTVNGSRIPSSTSVDFIASHYGSAFRGMLESQWQIQSTGMPSITGMILLLGLASLALPAGGRQPLVSLARAAVFAGSVFVLTLPQPGFRILFVLLPSAAVGFGLLYTRIGLRARAELRTRRSRRCQPVALE